MRLVALSLIGRGSRAVFSRFAGEVVIAVRGRRGDQNSALDGAGRFRHIPPRFYGLRQAPITDA